MSEPRLSRRAEQTAATRDALVAAGRVRFGHQGYAATSVEDVAADARLTIGALYHHFATKAGLFEAVLEAVEVEVLGRSLAAAEGATTALDLLRRAFGGFLDAVLEPDLQQILLVDGPAVLGPARFSEIEEQYSWSGIRDTLQAAADGGEIQASDIDTLAHLLLGACNQGGMLIARATDQGAARAAVGRTIEELIDGLAR